MGIGASSGLRKAIIACPTEDLRDALSTLQNEESEKVSLALRKSSVQEEVLVLCGPIIGTVTESTANILLEVDEGVTMACTATPLTGGATVSTSVYLWKSYPGVFHLKSLVPETEYEISFAPLNVHESKALEKRGCRIRTLKAPAELRKLRVVALSCDWPDRLGKGNENPWDRLATKCAAGDCDVMLHLGDQVYTWANGVTTRAMRTMDILDEEPERMTPTLRAKLERAGREMLQEAYRSTWSHNAVAKALAHSSHLMIWSDNDVTNDFTVARKPDGSQMYTPHYLKVAMGVYRMYQRSLWDPGCIDDPVNLYKADDDEQKEWHFHQYGPFGIFMIDMRGNRIDGTGRIKDAPILSETQRKAVQDAFATPGLACMLLCAEIPFVGEPPDEIRAKAEKLVFLKDHWPYCIDELTWLLDLCFSWKTEQAGREVILMAGDIHVSVESEILDKKTGTMIRHITTSPITNSVSKFWPALEGQINDRYSYTHKPLLSVRTFCNIDLAYQDGAASANIELVAVAADSSDSHD